MRKVTLLLATMALAVVLTALPAQAATFTVNSTTDAADATPGDGACSTAATEKCTLRAAIEEANALDGDDIIGFDPSVGGTITLGGSELLINSNLKIEGPGEDELSVDANSLSRVFRVQGATVEIGGLTITGGSADGDCGAYGEDNYNGGGIRNDGGTLAVSDATVSQNSANCRGAGIYNHEGTLTVSDSSVSGNDVGSVGGGIQSSGGNVTVEGSAISDNSAGLYGGGISSTSSETTITDSTISGNSASDSGGGLYAVRAPLTVSDSTISGNSANGTHGYVRGGGIHNEGGTATVSDTTISENTGADIGGGIYNLGGTLTVSASTISGNTANEYGGGIYSFTASNFSDSKTTVTDSTISGNIASNGYGGGLHNDNGLTQIAHSTITYNTAPAGKGGGVASFGDASTSTKVYSSIVSANTDSSGADTGTDVDFVEEGTNTFVSEGHNVIGDGNATAAFDKVGDQRGVSDPLLGPLQHNGGPTKTHLPLETQSSPLIDQGNSTQGLLVDQRGEARPHDHPDFANAQGSDASDVGAVEVIFKASEPPPATQACTIKGTGGKDVLRGTARRDVICAFGGNDTIKGMGGNDRVMGGSGRDTISGGTGDDRLYGGPGGDELDARDGSGGDLANGGRGDDTCSADRGDRTRNCQ